MDKIYRFTPRQTEVLHHLAKGKPRKQLADDLHMKIRTLDSHLQHLYNKTNIRPYAALAVFASKHFGEPEHF